MYASIIKSLSSRGMRVTAVIPHTITGGAVHVYSRLGESKGIRWEPGYPAFDLNEQVIGEPGVVAMTSNDYQAILAGTPTVLLQKLGREVTSLTPNQVTDDAVDSVFRIMLDNVTKDPSTLSRYKGRNKTSKSLVVPPVYTPVAQTTPQPTPMVEATTPEVQDVATTESETPMASTTISTALAVLTIPQPEGYVERSFSGLPEHVIYDSARANQENIVLTGPAGTGKSSSARHYAATNNLPFVVVECTQQIDQSITQGRFVPTGHGNETKWLYSQLATAVQQPSVILINEMSRMSPKAASLFLRLLQERELSIEPLNEVIKVHPDVLFIADQNIGHGYTGTVKQDNALNDRYAHKLEFEYDIKIESKFIQSKTLLEFADAIRQARELNDQFTVDMSTRILKNFQNHAQRLGIKYAVDSMLNNFPKSDGERDAIKMRFDSNVSRICEELGVDKGDYQVK